MYINKMGIELEGAWKGTKYVNPFPDPAGIKYDGSVHFRQPADGTFLHYGECISEPLTPEELKEWVNVHCPTDVNTSCGTHIHVSMQNPSMYACLLTPTFNRFILSKFTQYNENVLKDLDSNLYAIFKERLSGKNRYCKKGFKGLAQISMTSKGSERYHQLNYCYRLRGTIEIRVFPATNNPRVLCDFIDILTNGINEWCAREHRVDKVRFRRA